MEVEGQGRVDHTAYVEQGEDGANGAMRFAEMFAHNGVANLLSITSQLDAKAQQSGYTPPDDIMRCGKRGRPCSAGKLRKRAAESRKAELYDMSGADLIRALSKRGLEEPMVQRLTSELEHALRMLSKQREREAKRRQEQERMRERAAAEAEAMRQAQQRKDLDERDWDDFDASLLERLGAESNVHVSSDGTVEPTADTLTYSPLRAFSSYLAKDCNQTLQILESAPAGSERDHATWLVKARCHERLGQPAKALHAASILVQRAASHGTWKRGSPRMLAVMLGVNCAVEIGQEKKALRFYRAVLKYDPDNKRTRKQYKGLKKVLGLLGEVKAELEKGYSKKSMQLIDDTLFQMTGLDVDSPLFRSSVQLQRGTALARMAKFEEGLSTLDNVVTMRAGLLAELGPQRVAEAYVARADALLLDDGYAEAVSDLKTAMDLFPTEETQQKLGEANQRKEAWNGGQKDFYYNENNGFPDGKPPERDHTKILGLPVNLGDHEPRVRCKWLKKMYKKFAVQYHPDKYSGPNKARAERKFREKAESNAALEKEWECSGRGRRRRRG